MRYTIIVKPEHRDAANRAAKTVDTEGGEHTFTVPVVDDATGDLVGYIASWDMSATKHDIAALRQAFTDEALAVDEPGRKADVRRGTGVLTVASSVAAPTEVMARAGVRHKPLDEMQHERG